MYIFIYLSIYLSLYIYIHVCICIYTYRERERNVPRTRGGCGGRGMRRRDRRVVALFIYKYT